MADAPKKSAIVTARSKKPVSLPPGFMGFVDLIKPNEYEGKLKWNLEVAYNPAAIPLFRGIVFKQFDALLDTLREGITFNGGREKPPIDPEEWTEGKLKAPSAKARIQLPTVKISAPATRIDRASGEPVPTVMGCWDHNNQPVDFAALRVGRGSVIQPIVYVNAFASKALQWVPAPSLKLVGLRIIKLEQFGGRGAAAPDDLDDEAIKAVMGKDFQMDQSLADFAGGAPDLPQHDDDEDLPF